MEIKSLIIVPRKNFTAAPVVYDIYNRIAYALVSDKIAAGMFSLNFLANLMRQNCVYR